ncbi:MAG: hypothetical protein U0798_08540 [Gemmataceae bacterium]
MSEPTNSPFHRLSIIGVLMGFVLASGTVTAQLPPGKDCYVWPAGARAGESVDVRFGGSDWTPDIQFFLSDSRIKLEKRGPISDVLVPEPPYWFGIRGLDRDPCLPREVPVRLSIPAQVPPGPIRWRVANANGAAKGGLFWISRGREVIENESREGPQAIGELPVTLNGRIRRKDEVDRYSFVATSNGLVTAALDVKRLGNDWTSVIQVSCEGTAIAEVADTSGVDPAVTFPVQSGKTYIISVREIDHRGYRNFTYRLSLATGPRVVAAIPASLKRGERRSVEMIGEGLESGTAKRERKVVEVDVPRDAKEWFDVPVKTAHGNTTFTMPVSDEIERIAADGAALPVPCAVTGRFETRGQREFYKFQGKEGERWDIAIHAKELGSPVKSTLVVISPDGKNLAVKIDSNGVEDPSATVTIPRDGECRILLGNLSDQTSRLDATYRLTVRRPANRFSLTIPATASVPIGGASPFNIQVVREGDFKGPITLSIKGLPPGVTTASELVIPADKSTFPVTLACANSAGVSASFISVSGSATVDEKPVTIMAGTSDREPTMLLATALAPPFRVKVKGADNEEARSAFCGTVYPVELNIERREGFDGELSVDLAGAQQRHRQGIRGPSFAVKRDLSVVRYPISLPEHLDMSHPVRVDLVAMARVLDADGRPHWLLSPVEGPVTFTPREPLMTLKSEVERVKAVAGEHVRVPFTLQRSDLITGSVKLEWIIPRELMSLFQTEPMNWPGAKQNSSLVLKSQADPKLVGLKTLRVRATALWKENPVVSETEVVLDFQSKP